MEWPAEALPRTRPERTAFTETSLSEDVLRFLDSLRALRAPLHVRSMGTTTNGRDIPFVIASRPLVTSATEARRSGKPIVYVQGNIHGGEVEGKEALQALLRDLVAQRRANVLDSIVLIAVPNYNPDGNDSLGPQARNRPEQNGPEIVGRRANAQGRDLNRDYVKAEAPESRAALALFDEWDPDVFVDLHTTNGSYHGYALTYSPPMSPAALRAETVTREWLAVIRERMRSRHGMETFEYGNFGSDDDAWTDRYFHSDRFTRWTTFDSRPRFSTNYYGLRDRVAILSEAYSHNPFEKRIGATYGFVSEILSLASARKAELVALRRSHPQPGWRVAIRSQLVAAPPVMTVIAEEIVRTGDSSVTEAGVPGGIRRTGRFREVPLRVFTRYEATRSVPLPAAYVIPAELTGVLEALAAHGILSIAAPASARIERFLVDSIVRSERAFEGHREVRVVGSWRRAVVDVPAGARYVSTEQRLGRLAAFLLEPESEDGLVTWNFLDRELAPGHWFPIWRIPAIGR